MSSPASVSTPSPTSPTAAVSPVPPEQLSSRPGKQPSMLVESSPVLRRLASAPTVIQADRPESAADYHSWQSGSQGSPGSPGIVFENEFVHNEENAADVDNMENWRIHHEAPVIEEEEEMEEMEEGIEQKEEEEEK